jgi:hypothetical protein
MIWNYIQFIEKEKEIMNGNIGGENGIKNNKKASLLFLKQAYIHHQNKR